MGKNKKWKYRWLSHFYASFFGYFWKKCPICGEYFGGQESSDYCLLTTTHTGFCVCLDCGEKAIAMNKEKFPELFREIKIEV